MNESDQESEAPERDEPEQASGTSSLATASRDAEPEEARALRRAAGSAATGRGYERLTQLLVGTLNRRGLGGVVAGAVLTMGLEPRTGAKKKKKKKKKRKPSGGSSSAFRFLAGWGAFGDEAGEFDAPEGIAVGPDGSVYVADAGNARIQKFDPDGRFLTAWDAPSLPTALALDSAGNVYVVDRGEHRVVKFDGNGAFVTEWGEEGDGGEEFQDPAGITVDIADTVWVADSGNDRIKRYDADGEFELSFGGAAIFGAIAGLASDKDAGFRTLYITDLDDDDIQRRSGIGNRLFEVGSDGTGPGQFRDPRGIATGLGGVVFVADTGNQRIQQFTRDGDFVTAFGSRGNGNGEFQSPVGVATNAAGDVYVLDGALARVQKFRRR